MTHDTIARSIKVLVRQSHGGMYAHSPELPGLSIWADDEGSLDAQVIEGIRLLYKLNWQVDVTVFLSADPATRAPVRTPNFNEYTLARAA